MTRLRGVAVVELVIIALLLGAHLALRWPDSPIARAAPAGLAAFVDLDRERNLPAAVAGSMALGSCLALIAIARRERERGRPGTPWMLLAWPAALITVDEVLALHEVVLPLRAELAARNQLLLGWMLPAVLATAAIGALGLLALRSVQPRGRVLLAAGAFLYFVGGLAIEALGSPLWIATGPESRAAIAITTLEELVELIGLALVLYALMRHLAAIGPVESPALDTAVRRSPTPRRPGRQD